ncbi:hypothetical protein ACFVQ4_06330 [Streptomyces laurentii]|uniref:hypothetical protein n=1 Tax=Streptomyces laurentii TaxID=39478 RepID=UPI0036CE2DCB
MTNTNPGARYERRDGRRAATALLPLLLTALAACQSGGQTEAGGAKGTKSPAPVATPVFETRLDGQLSAASKATAAAGSSAFTATVSYGSAHGTAVDTSTGTQDYAADTARAERELTIPRRFPEDAASDLGGRAGGSAVRETYEVQGNRVDYLTRQGDWLRYSSRASMDIVDDFEGVLVRAGDSAPYGGTLAEVVRTAHATKQPAKGADGVRTYELSVPPRTAAPALPPALQHALLPFEGSEQITLTVVLDKQGRLLRAGADYAPALAALHKGGRLKGVTSLKAEYVLTGHGTTKVPAPAAGAAGGKLKDAEKALTRLTEVKAGSCGSADTGLGGSLPLVRVVPCGKGADVRVFGQVEVKETIQDNPAGVADRKAGDRCRTKFDTAPATWVNRARPAGTFYTWGGASSSSDYTGPDVDIEGSYACYVELSGRR